MPISETQLKQQSCTPCQGNADPLAGKELKAYTQEMPQGWHTVGERRLEKTFRFPDFVQALDFVNTVGAIAEREGHHPDITLRYNQVTLTLWTHEIKGLHSNDFIMATKLDRLAP